MSCFHLFFHAQRPQQLHTDLLGLLGLRLEINQRSVEKERRGKKRKFIQIHRDDNVVVDEEGCSWKTVRIQTMLYVIYLKGSIE